MALLLPPGLLMIVDGTIHIDMEVWICQCAMAFWSPCRHGGIGVMVFDQISMPLCFHDYLAIRITSCLAGAHTHARQHREQGTTKKKKVDPHAVGTTVLHDLPKAIA
mmetsp:Transcript_44181/g.76591  ORF Transcript_44181/g.76591 Transcript_44181/m.76591 type:complete len:107 (-) Transcript_44181:21-341(-)